VKKPARLRRPSTGRSASGGSTTRRSRRLPLPRRPLEWGLAILAIALVVIAITSLGTSSSSSSAATKRTSTVGKGVVQSTVSGNGTLEPAQKIELGFGASGEVTAIRVKAGQKVTKGEVLAEVDSSSARASLASAEAQLIEAEEAVEAAAEAEEEESEEVAYTGGARTVFVGLMSEDGTGAAKATEAEKVEMAEKEAAEKEAAEKAAAEGEAEKKPSKKEEAADEARGGEESEPQEASGEGSNGGANQEAAGESEGSTPSASGGGAESSGGSETGGSETGGAETGAGATVSLPTAEANLLSAQLSVKSARQEVRETTLRAPISGTIASVSGSVGETVSGGSSSGGDSEGSALGATGEESGGGSSESFIVLAQLQRLKMEVSFSEADIGKVREGQTATVAIDSMEGTELAGKVTKVSVLPSEGSSSVVEYPATILLTQSAKGLRAGMSASAEVVVEQVKNALTVPSEAISQAAGGKSVTVEEDGKEVTKTVTTGLVGDETTEVVSGVKSGQTLVLPEATVATASEGSSGGSGLEELRSAGGGASFSFPGGGATGGPPSFGGP
jgi:multidrug efflux pump subunit AcrA (membrane-fusion protein)